VRTNVAPEHLFAAIRTEVASVDRNIPVFGLQTMDGYLAQTTEQSRLSMTMLGVFGALGLLLAALGIYGVLSYLVSLRTQEIGVRLALGATSRDVLRLIVGHGMSLTAIGSVIGLAAAWAVTRSMKALLFDLSPHDPATYATIVVILGIVAFLASYLPGRRATRVDPLIALRSE
jgi:putative ABC transport system permease protein